MIDMNQGGAKGYQDINNENKKFYQLIFNLGSTLSLGNHCHTLAHSWHTTSCIAPNIKIMCWHGRQRKVNIDKYIGWLFFIKWPCHHYFSSSFPTNFSTRSHTKKDFSFPFEVVGCAINQENMDYVTPSQDPENLDYSSLRGCVICSAEVEWVQRNPL